MKIKNRTTRELRAAEIFSMFAENVPLDLERLRPRGARMSEAEAVYAVVEAWRECRWMRSDGAEARRGEHRTGDRVGTASVLGAGGDPPRAN